MRLIRRFIAVVFLLFLAYALQQCARRGSPTGGPKDTEPPVLIREDPANFSTNFTAKKIRLYFDEYIKLQDVQNQLIISPPMEYPPDISPQGGASKYVEIIIKDTLEENTTYTLNFGQSIVDNNESNPNPFLSYVFSTGDYLDSLALNGSVKDAFNKEAESFISVMLYKIDTAYSDSVVSKKVPNYLTNTQDSTINFKLKNLKEGRYRLIAIKDVGKNNLYDAVTDKIGFIADTISLPSDSSYTLNLFREIPKYSAITPKLLAANKIIFPYKGGNESLKINPVTKLPDSIITAFMKEPGRDTINYWITPVELDSLLFEVVNERLQKRDTFTIKTRKLDPDSLLFSSNVRGKMMFKDTLALSANIPIVQIDTAKFTMVNRDSVPVLLNSALDTLGNKAVVQFNKEPNQTYQLSVFPGALTDVFGTTNDTLEYRISTGSYADYGNLRVRLEGDITYPLILQLVKPKGELIRSISSVKDQLYEFDLLEPSNYLLRVIFDENANNRWDTGNFLEKIQPEKIVYYPLEIEVRANWELEQVFTIEN